MHYLFYYIFIVFLLENNIMYANYSKLLYIYNYFVFIILLFCFMFFKKFNFLLRFFSAEQLFFVNCAFYGETGLSPLFVGGVSTTMSRVVTTYFSVGYAFGAKFQYEFERYIQFSFCVPCICAVVRP